MAIDNYLITSTLVGTLINNKIISEERREEVLTLLQSEISDQYINVTRLTDIEMVFCDMLERSESLLKKIANHQAIFNKYFNVDLPKGNVYVKIFYKTPFIQVLHFFLDKFFDTEIGLEHCIATCIEETIDHCLIYPNLNDSPLLEE